MTPSWLTTELALQTVPSWVAASFTLVGAIAGALVTQLATNRRDAHRLDVEQERNKQRLEHERKLKQDEIFFESLEWFTKGSQRRNVGITAVEAFRDNKRLTYFSVPLLIGTAIYLLEESKQESAAHELNNLRRIMPLLVSARRQRSDDEHEVEYSSLLESVKRARERKEGDKGLEVPSEDLERWEGQLSDPTE